MDSKMQIAYQEFMLGKRNSGVPTPPKETYRRTAKKKSGYRLVLRAVQGRLEEWMEIDQKLEDILRSIANFRDRIYWESHYLGNQSVSDERSIPVWNQKKATEQRPSWNNYGFRTRSSIHSNNNILYKQDVILALDHDLLQHERMLSALRSLLASLAKIVEEIGRRLDDWMLQNLSDQNDGVSEETEFKILVKEENMIELAQEVYSRLALDLYMKQKIATQVLDSCHNGLLSGDDNSPNKRVYMLDSRNVMKLISDGLRRPTNRSLTCILVEKLLLVS
mmetsp:Transcript_26922/g.63234  ORF Transcript_26922/g.63234 Transcript_26922/m.63234 type:complete len:278 (-) Transcript_26922:2163-2996(-)